MNLSIPRLGIFELIGYLFSGFYVAASFVIPFFAVGLVPEWIESLSELNALFGAFTVAICYAVGIFASSFSLQYYDGSKYLPINEPKMCPFSRCKGSKKRWTRDRRDEIWDRVDEKINEITRRKDVSPLAPTHTKDMAPLVDKISERDKNRIELAYNTLAYSSPLLSSVDRIASAVRFTGSVVFGSLLSIITTFSLFVSCCIINANDGGLVSAPNWEAYVILLLLSFIFLLLADGLSREYANSYWGYVAMGILSIPAENEV